LGEFSPHKLLTTKKCISSFYILSLVLWESLLFVLSYLLDFTFDVEHEKKYSFMYSTCGSVHCIVKKADKKRSLSPRLELAVRSCHQVR